MASSTTRTEGPPCGEPPERDQSRVEPASTRSIYQDPPDGFNHRDEVVPDADRIIDWGEDWEEWR